MRGEQNREMKMREEKWQDSNLVQLQLAAHALTIPSSNLEAWHNLTLPLGTVLQVAIPKPPK